MIVDFEGRAAFVPRSVDDVRAIRQDCKSIRQWQVQLLASLCDSGWTLAMLVWLPAADPAHWFEILILERLDRWKKFDPSFEIDSPASTAAISSCGHDREAWLQLILKCLVDRGWTRTMLSEALATPRTNIIRRLDAAESNGWIASPEAE